MNLTNGLEHYTYGGINKQDNSNIYLFTDLSLDSLNTMISDIAAAYSNYTIWFNKSAVTAEQYRHFLPEMQMIIMYVTETVVNTPDLISDIILPIAAKHQIPLLPIIASADIYDAFNRISNNRQCIPRYKSDTRASRNSFHGINADDSYEQQLKAFLETTLSKPFLKSKITEIWDIRFFLSYRKKNYLEAKKVMKQIHSHSECHYASIWFDHFLTPGERFDDEIQEMIRQSDIFILLITPDILEADNYVMKNEYPDALKLNKFIVPIEIVPTNREQLACRFPDLPPIISAKDKKSFTAELSQRIAELSYQRSNVTKEYVQKMKNYFHISGVVTDEQMEKYFTAAAELRRIRSNNPVKASRTLDEKYYLGIALIDGIGTEPDIRTGIRYLKACANRGHVNSVHKLVWMYLYGQGVKTDVDEALSIAKKSADYWISRTVKYKNEYNLHNAVNESLELVDLYEENDRYELAVKTLEDVFFLFCEFEKAIPANAASHIMNLLSLKEAKLQTSYLRRSYPKKIKIDDTASLLNHIGKLNSLHLALENSSDIQEDSALEYFYLLLNNLPLPPLRDSRLSHTGNNPVLSKTEYQNMEQDIIEKGILLFRKYREKNPGWAKQEALLTLELFKFCRKKKPNYDCDKELEKALNLYADYKIQVDVHFPYENLMVGAAGVLSIEKKLSQSPPGFSSPEYEQTLFTYIQMLENAYKDSNGEMSAASELLFAYLLSARLTGETNAYRNRGLQIIHELFHNSESSGFEIEFGEQLEYWYQLELSQCGQLPPGSLKEISPESEQRIRSYGRSLSYMRIYY